MNLKSELIKRSPDILFGTGILGFITAVVMSAKATPKAIEIMEKRKCDGWYDPHDSSDPPKYPRMLKVKDIAPVYIPTIGMVLLSTGMLLASDRIVRNRYASLFALYSITERAMREWESSTSDNVTKKKFHKIKESVLGPADPPPNEDDYIDGSRLFWDPYSGRYFYAQSVDTVRRIFSDINLRLVKEDFVPLNDFYYALDMEPIGYGNDNGWSIEDGEVEPTFDSIMKFDRAYIQVEYTIKPRKW